MATTYDFTTARALKINNVIVKNLEGPVVAEIGADVNTFSVRTLTWNDLFYYDSRSIFKIDGVLFEGTAAEYCDAIEALYETAGEGGGWSDITADTTAQISEGKILTITDQHGNTLLKAKSDELLQEINLGDSDSAITEGASGTYYCSRSSTGSFGSIDMWFDNYASYASLGSYANSATQASVQATVDTPGFTGGLRVDQVGIHYAGVVEYADNAAAITGGLTAGYIYRTGDALKIVH